MRYFVSYTHLDKNTCFPSLGLWNTLPGSSTVVDRSWKPGQPSLRTVLPEWSAPEQLLRNFLQPPLWKRSTGSQQPKTVSLHWKSATEFPQAPNTLTQIVSRGPSVLNRFGELADCPYPPPFRYLPQLRIHEAVGEQRRSFRVNAVEIGTRTVYRPITPPLEGESRKPSRQARAEAVGGRPGPRTPVPAH